MVVASPLRTAPPLAAAPSFGSAFGRGQQLRLGMVSTYPPKLCGLATFASALTSDLRAAGNRVDVVRVDDGSEPQAIGGADEQRLVNGNVASLRLAAARLSRCDAVIIQHEYGIFGGTDGDEVLDLIAAIDAPTIVVLHTVPLQPTTHQREVLVELSQLADRVVVMTASARDRLLASYPVDAQTVETIPHGATLPSPQQSDRRVSPRDRSLQLLTWGLLGPGKGVEHVIDALPLLGSLPHPVQYTIAGVTHPKVFAAHGDVYRQSLVNQARAVGVSRSVRFDDDYRDLAELTRFVASTDVVVLPYDSVDQVTSGVLVDAIAAGRPVIATAFPHAVELLGDGAGIVVPHRDPVALANAIRAMVMDPNLLRDATARAQRLAPSMSWARVADSYATLARALLATIESVAM